jgi:hypothetical protein
MKHSQFPDVSSRYGAPMGRPEVRTPEPIADRSIAVFRVKLDWGGYDDGGAYWGAGQPIYCARSDSGSFRRFIRASSRAAAIQAMGLEPRLLKRKA